MSEVFEAVRTLLAVRDYQDKAVPDEVIRRIVEAGHLSASGGNQQPWHFVVVRDRQTLVDLGAMIRTGPYVARSAFAIVAAYDKAKGIYGMSDTSRAIQSMVLTAWAEGVGSNWTGFGGLEEESKKVGIPDTYDVLAVLPFGYPRHSIGKGKKERKPLSQVASTERFGTSFAG
jgi:nitroreductase